METLIEKLLALKANENYEDDSSKYLTDGAHDELPVEIQEIVDLANACFIASNGNPIYGNIIHVEEKAGVKIGPGEKDSFGWLSGVIRTPKGKIVFG